jgi:hypothetical protein
MIFTGLMLPASAGMNLTISTMTSWAFNHIKNGGLTGMHRITADKGRTKFIKEDNQQGESIYCSNHLSYSLLSRLSCLSLFIPVQMIFTGLMLPASAGMNLADGVAARITLWGQFMNCPHTFFHLLPVSVVRFGLCKWQQSS